MKKLYFLRHAQSGHPQGVDDKDRPINRHGQQECEAMARYLLENNICPELVICSDALRTTQTAKAVFQPQPSVKIEYNKKLYLATPGEILREISKIDDKVNSLMVVAHNPGIQQTSFIIAGSGDKVTIAEIKNDYPTCALAAFSFNIGKWQDVQPGKGLLGSFIVAKEL